MQLPHQPQTVHAAHAQIAQHHVKIVVGQQLQRDFRAGSRRDGIRFPRQIVPQQRQHFDFVIDNKYGGMFHGFPPWSARP
jgi:hypothetical protein